MKILPIVLFGGGVVFVILMFTLLLTRGSVDVTVFDHYFVILPRYLLFIAAGMLIAGCVPAVAPHP